MGQVKIEGKEISLDDGIIDAGIPAIKAALSVDFPDVENADIEIVRPAGSSSPRTATVVKRGTGKGSPFSVPIDEQVTETNAVPVPVREALHKNLDRLIDQMATTGDGGEVISGLDNDRVLRLTLCDYTNEVRCEHCGGTGIEGSERKDEATH